MRKRARRCSASSGCPQLAARETGRLLAFCCDVKTHPMSRTCPCRQSRAALVMGSPGSFVPYDRARKNWIPLNQSRRVLAREDTPAFGAVIATHLKSSRPIAVWRAASFVDTSFQSRPKPLPVSQPPNQTSPPSVNHWRDSGGPFDRLCEPSGSKQYPRVLGIA